MKWKIFLVIFFLFNFSLRTQTLQEYVLKKEDITYGIILPVNYNPNRKYLLGICLHGLGGNGIDFAIKLGYYSRYMNMILACPNGNVPDPLRNSTKWGEGSEEYVLNFVKKIQSKYLVSSKVALFGFSQGGNFGLNLSLKYSDMFSHFVGISGGYTETSEELLENINKFPILLLSGDTGPGEVYTKKALDNKYKFLSKYTKDVIRITLKGEKHELSPKLNYSAMKWYAKTNPAFKSDFWIFRGNYYFSYLKALNKFETTNYKKAVDEIKKSLKLNPIFPPSHLLFLLSSWKLGNLTSLQKSIFMTLQFYSNEPYFDAKGIFEFFKEFYITIVNDEKLKEYYIGLFSEKILELEDILLPVYSGEIYFLLYKLETSQKNFEQARYYKQKAIYYFSQVPTDDLLYKQAKVEEKISLFSESVD